MTGEILSLFFKDGRCFLTPDISLSLEQIDVLEPYADSELKPNITWTVRVASFNKDDGTLRCFFMSIQHVETIFPVYSPEILERLNNIERISFPNMDTVNLLNTFIKPKPNFFRKEAPPSLTSEDYEKRLKPYPKQETPPVKSTKREDFSISMKDVQFNNGSVTVKKKFTWREKEIDLTIKNDYVKSEHDPIKNYFANVLEAKKINVTGTFDLEDGEIVHYEAKSLEIERINDSLIEEVKINFTRSIKNKSDEREKNLFSMEEFIAEFGEEKLNAKTLFPDEKSFLEALMKVSDPKHYEQLEYLASLHCHSIMKLRFIPKPISFIFLLETKDSFALVWETLDTAEATYIWKRPKDLTQLKEEIAKLDEALTFIKAQGKTEYIKCAPGYFDRAFHDYNGTPLSFDIWKMNLQGVLNATLNESA